MNKLHVTLAAFCFTVINLVVGQQPQELWKHRFNGSGDFSQQYSKVVAARNGGYFLGGTSVCGGNQKDMLLVRINEAGDTLWRKFYNGSAGKDDAITGMVSDSLDNVIFCGYKTEKNKGKDLFVVKVASDGKLIWSYAYNNDNASGDDIPVSLTVDGAGNVFVTGSTDNEPGPKTNMNIVTQKIDKNGVLVWSKLYDGSGEFDDLAVALALNAKGELFICGNTDNGSDLDIVTLKYRSNGSLEWMKAHNKGKNDVASAITVDKGFVYVAGTSDNGRENDFAVLKYSFSGAENWANGVYFNGPALGNDAAIGIITDLSGNVYVAGMSDQDVTANENMDFCLIKLNINGTQQWVKTWGNTKEQRDTPSALFFGAEKEIVVAGTALISGNKDYPSGDFHAMAYAASGNLLWEQTHEAEAGYMVCTDATSDASGNIILVGKVREKGGYDMCSLVTFSGDGKFKSHKSIENPGENTDRAHKMIMDQTGNTYLCGYTFAMDGQRDMFVERLSPEGYTNWKYIYQSETGENDEATDLCIDANGNVYVTGYSTGKKKDYDVQTLKISPDGMLEWAVNYDYLTAKGDDKGTAVVLDAEGNVYVVGVSDGDPGSRNDQDIIVIKYNPKGVLVWNRRYTGKAAGDDYAVGAKALSGNRIVVAGNTFNGIDEDVVIMLFNDAGLIQWENTHNSNIGNDHCEGMTLDNGEKITLVGTSFNGKDNDMLTLQYTPDGILNWVNQYDAGKDESGVAVAADASRNIYATGNSLNGSNSDVIVLKLSDNGVKNWVDTYNGEDDLNDGAADIAVDNGDFILVTGYSEKTKANPQADLLIRKYHPNFGVPVWNKLIDGGFQLKDYAECILIDKNSNILVAGSGFSKEGQEDIVVFKYDSPLNLHEITYPGTGINLFPNPFTDEITIDLFNDKGIMSFIDIYSLNGKKVKSFKTTKSEMIIDKKTIKPGVYLYNVTQNSEVVQTGKIILK